MTWGHILIFLLKKENCRIFYTDTSEEKRTCVYIHVCMDIQKEYIDYTSTHRK